MSREIRRVEPLPDPFALSVADTADSPLHRRVVFIARPDDEAARRLAAALCAVDGVTLAGPSGLFRQGLDMPWRAFHLTSDVGLPPLLTGAEFLRLLRGLADDLLLPALGTGRVLVEWSPQHADPRSVETIRSLYPDATVVETDTDADAVLADLARLLAAPPPPHQAAPSSPLHDRLIVVVGCGRSGTTWLEELLLAHPDIGGLSGHETWLFHQLGHVWRAYDGPEPTALSSWLDRPTFRQALRTYCDGVLMTALHRHSQGARFYVEKTPVHSERLPEIAAVYPDAWFVHLLRDGRDVARSMSQVPFFSLPDPADAAAVWARVVRTVRAAGRDLPRFRELRYEDLHADPVREMQSLWRWIGLDDGVPEPSLRAVAADRVSTHAGTRAPVGPGTWRDLPRSSIAGIYRAAGDELRRAGYATRSQVWLARLDPRAQRH